MSRIFKIKDNIDFAEINCNCINNYNDFRTLANEISNKCRQNSNYRILIQNCTSQHFYPLHCLLIVECLNNAGITKHHKIALVDPLKDKANGEDKLLVTIAMKKGLNNIKIFKEPVDAKLWLGVNVGITTDIL